MEKEQNNFRTSSQIAKIFGMTSKRVQQLTADGIINTVETPKGRRYNYDSTVEAYIKYLSDKANGREKREVVSDLEEAKLTAEVELKQSKAEAAKIALAELQGKMHKAEDVESIMTDHVLYLRSMLMAMPGKLAVDLANLHTAPEMAERVKQEVYYILDNLADYRYDPETYRKRVMERQGWDNRQEDENDEA